MLPQTQKIGNLDLFALLLGLFSGGYQKLKRSPFLDR